MTREEKLQQFAEQTTKGLYLDRHNLIQMVKTGAEWADSHPQWIPVEEKRYPPKKNKWDKKSEEVLIYGLWMGHPTRLFGTYHYDINEWSANGLISNITHWMEIVPPREEE